MPEAPKSAKKSSRKAVVWEKPGFLANKALRSWAALLGMVVLLAFFWSSPLLFPLRILVVFFHELGHAAAAVLTGGSLVEISLRPNEGGLARTLGGNVFLILNAGYLGSLVTGLVLLLGARRQALARGIVGLLGLVLLGSSLFYVRPLLSFGFLFGSLIGLGIFALGIKAPPWAASWFLRFIGLFSVFYALLDIRDDVLSGSGGASSDAGQLAALTGVPSLVWGLGWILASIVLLWLLRRRIV